MLKVGILGGGQLGRMLLQTAANYPVLTHVLENDPECPAAHLCHHFTLGDIRDFDTVYQFGKKLDCLTIEIEQVNIEALEKLEEEGLLVIPKPATLRIIRNKIVQKEFYKNAEIPTAEFSVTQSRKELNDHLDFLPAAHKTAEGGYDGKGVQLIKDVSEVSLGFDVPSVLEKMVSVAHEIAVIVAIGQHGENAVYPPVEMIFDAKLNLLDYQLCPASIGDTVTSKAEQIALELVKKFNSPGLFAVELFVSKTGEVLVNETAPRVHNSGHHSIEAIHCSQFDMLWRILLKLPLGSTEMLSPSVMVNIVGADGEDGPVRYEGLEKVLAVPGAYVHLYGKAVTKPGRKMGHVNLLGSDLTDLGEKAHWVKNTLIPKK